MHDGKAPIDRRAIDQGLSGARAPARETKRPTPGRIIRQPAVSVPAAETETIATSSRGPVAVGLAVARKRTDVVGSGRRAAHMHDRCKPRSRGLEDPFAPAGYGQDVTLDRTFCKICGSIACPSDWRCTRCGEPLPLKEHARDNRAPAVYWPVVLRIALAELIYIAVHGSGLL